MISVAEFKGIEAAMGRLGEVRDALARLGDARPFAALHIWLAEMESTRGYLSSARHHLERAESLLRQVDDVWLQGYLAINRSVVSYYCAEITEARHWAELAIKSARTSGHRGTLCAANASLGHTELSQSNLIAAEDHFRAALACCEEGSVNQLAMLDSIAQVRLQRGDLDGCGALLNQVEDLSGRTEHGKSRYYETWALHTKIQLLLKAGKREEAQRLTRKLNPSSTRTPQPRINTAFYLLATETLIAAGNLVDAARMLCSVLSPTVHIAPDLFAEMERVTATAVKPSGDDLARVHLDRAVRTFKVIGHSIGHSAASVELNALSELPQEHPLVTGSRKSLDRIRALMDTRSRSELFGHEAVSLIEELQCAESVTLMVRNGPAAPAVIRHIGATSSSSACILINLNKACTSSKNVILSFIPREDPGSIVTSLEVQRVIEQITAIDVTESVFADFDLVWAANNWSNADGVVFAAESTLAILKTVKKIAPTDVSVLITGETGVGKEIIAKSVHEQSTRAAMPFVALNCAAVPKELLESQLFGYRKGAFSGATEPFQGVVRASNGGTLLLDEISELPLDTQAKLLRFLELGEVHPIGEAYPLKVNVRLLFSTNDDLEKAVKEKRFREDLFYRLNVVRVKIPPLRERRDEIPLLVRLFSTRFAREFSKEPATFSAGAMELLILHTWPGNVRQLSNEIRRITALMDSGEYVTADVLSPEITAREEERRPVITGSPVVTINLDQTLARAGAHLERQMVEYALRTTEGRVADAAKNLGLTRKGLYLKRRRFGLMDHSSLQSAT
jgi:DNA-binding NtrC family response regulator